MKRLPTQRCLQCYQKLQHRCLVRVATIRLKIARGGLYSRVEERGRSIIRSLDKIVNRATVPEKSFTFSTELYATRRLEWKGSNENSI